MPEDDVLILERDGPIAVVTLNRPKVHNAFNAALRIRLAQAVEEVGSDASIRIAIIQGAGPGFCAGADLSEGMPDSIARQIEEEYKPFLMGIALSDTIWIAAMHGTAAGIGGALAMACDLSVMEEDASIYLAFAAIGLIPDGGATWQLLNAMGYRKALEIIIEGRRITASQCLEHGLANRIVPPGQAGHAAREWARQLCAGAPLAQAGAKKALRHMGRMRLQDAITLEAKIQEKLVASEDFRHGVEAFFGKRKPNFRGR